MKKRIKKHILRQDFVKVYQVDNDGYALNNFEGIILEQNDLFILMIDFLDFTYDGLVVLPKSTIDEIKHTDNERHYKYLLEKESLLEDAIHRGGAITFRLANYQEMFDFLSEKQLPILLECQSGTNLFQLGPVLKASKKKVTIDYINVRGEYSLKPVKADYIDITFFRVDNPYTNIFFKYAKRIA